MDIIIRGGGGFGGGRPGGYGGRPAEWTAAARGKPH